MPVRPGRPGPHSIPVSGEGVWACIPKLGTEIYEPPLELKKRRVHRHLGNVARCLIVKERLILAFYLSIPDIRAHLRSAGGGGTLKDKLLAGLYRLVFQYAPALLRLGIMVRDCSWYHCTPGTVEAARRCRQVSLYLIQKLNPHHRDGGYKRTLHLALRMWSPYHFSLPACAFVEEKEEAPLSRLAREVGEGTSITTVDDYHNAFVTLRHQEPGTRKPLTSPRITR